MAPQYGDDDAAASGGGGCGTQRCSVPFGNVSCPPRNPLMQKAGGQGLLQIPLFTAATTRTTRTTRTTTARRETRENKKVKNHNKKTTTTTATTTKTKQATYNLYVKRLKDVNELICASGLQPVRDRDANPSHQPAADGEFSWTFLGAKTDGLQRAHSIFVDGKQTQW